MVSAMVYVFIMSAGFIGALPVLIWLFGEPPGATRFENDRTKKEVKEMLMFSGLEAQGEINRLLDELYGALEQASLAVAEECERRGADDLANGEPMVEKETDEELGATEFVLAP